MPTTETKIWLALKAQVLVAALANSLAVAWPAAELFTPPSSGATLLPYLAVGYTSGGPQRQFVGSQETQLWTGVLTLVRAAPLGASLAAHTEAAATLVAPYFREGTGVAYDGVRVCFMQEPSVKEGYRDNGYWRTPVVIPWRVSSAY